MTARDPLATGDFRARQQQPAVSACEPAASVVVVWPFLALAEQADRDRVAPRVCRFLGITEAELANPDTRVPLSQLAHLLEIALARSGDRNIGLSAARQMHDVHLGPMEAAARAGATRRCAVEAGIRYVPLVGDGVRYSFDSDGEVAVFRIGLDPGISIHPAASEFVVALGTLWWRRVAGLPDYAPLEVHFAHPQPADISLHEDIFRCKLVFDAHQTQVVSSAASLERPLRGHEPVIARMLRRRAEALLKTLPRSRRAGTLVRQVLATRPELGQITAGQVARRLGMGERTLARRLRGEHTSYREVLDELRKEAAQRALLSSDRSLSEIAESLGFASAQGFNRAFKRWTGTSAGAWRRAHRLDS